MVIDEFQDTSAVQYGLLHILASHKRITIVGDEDQVKLKLVFLTLSSETFFSRLAVTSSLLLFPSSTLLLRVFNIILQSIFGFSGADASGFDSFRKDFSLHKEVRQTLYYNLSF